MKKDIILASKSPRRKELLEQINLNFNIYTEETDETFDKNLSPAEIVEYLAYKKASAVADKGLQDSIIIGADTIVMYNEEILLKPKDEQEAYASLEKLSGKTHSVYTGISIIDTTTNHNYTSSAITEVRMKTLSNEEINFYIKTGEPMDKAGSYGIQGIGAIFIEGLNGDYFNVVGLPISKLYEGFEVLGMKLLDFIS